MSNAIETIEPRRSILATMAYRYDMEPEAFEATLRGTIMKPDKDGNHPNKAEFAAFLVVANQYNLNPLTKEIYAFFDRQRGGIIPIVGVDGWSRIINEHPAFDGMTFVDHHDDKGNVAAITCRMHRKDRNNAIEATEYLVECRRDTSPWKQWPRRMLRHKAAIQAARYAFGFAGVYDQDEAERIVSESPKSAAGNRASTAAPLAARMASLAAPPHDPKTGEVADSANTPSPEFDRIRFEHAYNDGRAAALDGASRTDCPADLTPQEREKWLEGFNDADSANTPPPLPEPPALDAGKASTLSFEEYEKLGRQAALDGLSRTDCPLNLKPEERGAWRYGFDKADEEANGGA